MQARVAIRLDDSTSTDLRSRSSSLSDGRLPSAVSRRSQAGGLSTVSLTARSRCSRRQLFAGLRAHHVLGVPLRPVRILLPGPLLVLAVRLGGLAEGLLQVARRIKRRCHHRSPLDPTSPAATRRAILTPGPEAAA